jgi:peptidoglycan/xylan/chitin deacetylase (PgdA/CDA1 family)
MKPSPLFLIISIGFPFAGTGMPATRDSADSCSGSRVIALQADATHRSVHPPALPAVAPQVIAHGARDQKLIALTFDACSTREPSHYDDRVTEVLVKNRTPATIFLGGKWIEEEQEHAKFLASSPQFELGNHTFLHPHLTEISDDRIREELQRTQEALYAATGKQATLFRPPYGEYNDRVVKIAASLGLTTVEYDIASGDPDRHATKEKLIEYVTEETKNGSIIVMHINRRGWHTAEALPDIIRILRGRGYTFVTVGELLRGMHHNGGYRQ